LNARKKALGSENPRRNGSRRSSFSAVALGEVAAHLFAHGVERGGLVLETTLQAPRCQAETLRDVIDVSFVGAQRIAQHA
jgi:hypothetical protein